MIETGSNTDQIRVLTIQEYEDLMSFVTAMKSSALSIRDVVTVAAGDVPDSASAAAACSSARNTETVEEHRDVIDYSRNTNTIDVITPTSSTEASHHFSSDDSSTIFIDLASTSEAEPNSTSNKVDGIIPRPTTADVSYGSVTSTVTTVADVACGEDLVSEVIEAASPVPFCCPQQRWDVVRNHVSPDRQRLPSRTPTAMRGSFRSHEASSNTETTVYCSRCMCADLTSRESGTEFKDAENRADSSKKPLSISVGCSTEIQQVAEVASGVDTDDVSNFVALLSCKTVTREQSCNTELQPEVKESSPSESTIDIAKTTVGGGASSTDDSGVEQLWRRRTSSSPMSSNSVASASKIPTRRRSTRTHDSAVNTDVTITPCTVAMMAFEKW